MLDYIKKNRPVVGATVQREPGHSNQSAATLVLLKVMFYFP